ncbi:uncharacterized protein [Antedon mediterranea]|uniref:uncharacterized protein isoform X3 n=1 Tax=Antedon mediterranea TaxID=105859 RepID=UPI003AF85DE7
MHLKEGDLDDLRWRRDGNVIDSWSGSSNITIPYVTKDDGGIYECYLNGSRHEGRHAIVRLIVRGCSASRWGTDCQNLCPTCYNGGICDDVSGLCVCPPGFKGEDCSEGCGNNHWGRTCTHVCSSSNPGCSGSMGCIPDPLGCSCMAGYKDLDCKGTCETTGYYGSTCSEQCHCAAGVTCDPSRGCPDGPCEDGYSGKNCQVPNECTGGWYGDLCKYQCHCEDYGPCERNTGSCGDRKCKHLWIGSDCQLDGRTNVNLVVPSSNRGALLTITCIIQANPIPRDVDIKVLHGDVVLGNGVSTVTELNYTNTIVFSEINMKEGDVFKCQVQSDISGNTKTEEAVTIYDPPVMTTKPNVIVSDSTVTISWNEWTATGQNGDGPLIGYSVCYRQTAEKWKPCSELVTGLSITYNIEANGEDGFHRGVDYELGVIAVRPGNLGNANMSPLTQLFIPCLLPDAVQNVKTESQKNSITITWTSPKSEHCKIDFYKLKYKLQNQCLCAENQNEDESTVWLSETSHTITSLEAYTSYIINISAVTHQLKDDQYLEGPITTVNATTSEEDTQIKR